MGGWLGPHGVREGVGSMEDIEISIFYIKKTIYKDSFTDND